MSVFINIAAYKFASLGDLERLRTDLRAMCIQAGMHGTILLSPEGINVFVATERPAADRFPNTSEPFLDSPISPRK